MLSQESKNKKSKVKKINISGFVKKPLTSGKEQKDGKKFSISKARKRIQNFITNDNGVSDAELEESLTEIYQEDNGDMANVRKLDIKKKRGFLFWFFSFWAFTLILTAFSYGIYYFIYNSGSDATAVEFYIDSKERLLSGEEFFYTINYKNLSSVNLRNSRIEIKYPDNFIFLDSSLPWYEKNSVFLIDNLMAFGHQEIKIKGKIINTENSSNVIFARLNYVPENFSSEFKKEVAHTIVVDDLGLDFVFDYNSTVLLGEENEILLGIDLKENNFFNNFNLRINPLENLQIIEVAAVDKNDVEENFGVKKIKNEIWQISGLEKENASSTESKSFSDCELKIKFKITEKISDEEKVPFVFFIEDDENEYNFLEKNLKLDVIKSDLSLNLIINGSREDFGADFGNKLNYSIVYANKGETSMEDLVIMAVLDSDFLDWTSLEDENNGNINNDTIFWGKEEIAELENLGSGEEGTIDFSIDLIDFRENDLGKNFKVESYVYFSIGDPKNSSQDNESGEIIEREEESDNRSNKIIISINSDLSLKEELRYFNEDNIPVGSGPLPPKVGNETSFKVYWTLANNLHELRDAKIELTLPSHVNWDNKNRTSVGSIKYIAKDHKVLWHIGRLPITVYKADAEFNISIKPKESDQNKILVILPGSIVTAIDNETNNMINKRTSPKTSRLEDDDIASIGSDGRVE